MVLAVYLNRINVSLFSLDFLLDSQTPLLLLFLQTMFVTTFVLFIYFRWLLIVRKISSMGKKDKSETEFFEKNIEKHCKTLANLSYA